MVIKFPKIDFLSIIDFDNKIKERVWSLKIKIRKVDKP